MRLSPRDPLAAVYCGIASYAQFVGRNYDDAMRLAREAIRQRADFVGAHRVLTAAAGMIGQIDVAAAALQELRRVQPNISLGWIAKQMPEVGETRRVAVKRIRNDLSIVLHISVGSDTILLGGDLEEEGNPLTGWSATFRPAPRYSMPTPTRW